MSTQSLPSFAQAFSNRSLSTISRNNALPPIMPSPTSRKRTQDEDIDDVHVKQELQDPDSDGAPPPSSLMPAPKKRRVTVSGGAPHPLHIDVRPAQDHQANSTPISPVVMGFTIQRDNPNAIEQVRNMINVKQKQKALIEQRRGSAAGLMSPVGNQPPIDDRLPPPQSNPPPNSGSTPRTRRSPNTGTGARRLNNSSQRPPSPPPPLPQASMQMLQQHILQQQQQQQPAPPPPPQHSLPPPPISFARRRAALMGGKKKPADIVISPREAHTREQFQLSIQSAPPIPQAGGQNQFYTNRGAFQMALPRLPTITGSENPRRVAGNVPPTPTRLSMLQHAQQQGHQGQLSHTSQNHPLGGLSLHPPSSAVPNRSPPASIPIATTLVPPTPTSLHRPGYAGDKAAFLTPFEVFYDALNDSKQLKTWLGDQLKESRHLMQTLAAQQDRMHDVIDGLVEKKVTAVRAEVTALRGRVAELEEMLAHNNANVRPMAQQQQQRPTNGAGPLPPVASEAYTFPPASSAAHAAPSTSQQSISASASGSGTSENAVASTSTQLPTPVSSRLRADRPELARRLSSPGWGVAEQQQQQREGGIATRTRPMSDNGGSPRALPALSRQGAGVPMVVVSGGSSSNTERGERGSERDRDREMEMDLRERDLRERARKYEERNRDWEREREREREREYTTEREYSERERDRDRGSVAMDGVEDAEQS